MSGSVTRSRTAATVTQPPGSPSARSRDQVRPALTLTHMPPSPSSAYSRLVLWYGDATDTNDAGVRVSGAARLPPKSAISPPDGPTRYVYFSVNATPSPSRALGTRVHERPPSCVR